MWLSVRATDLIATYEGECWRPPDPGILEILARLNRGTDPDLFAATSLGHLRFTRATSYEHADVHDAVWVTPRDGALSLSLVPAGKLESVSGIHVAEADLAVKYICKTLSVRLPE